MERFDTRYIQGFLKMLLESAKKMREDAGYSGAMNDGGASMLEGKVEAFKAGMKGYVPVEWQKSYRDYERETKAKEDPEYETFVRLKRKFESM